MGESEFGKCDICGKETELDRTYFYYPFIANAVAARIRMGKNNISRWFATVRIALHLYRKKFILCLEV